MLAASGVARAAACVEGLESPTKSHGTMERVVDVIDGDTVLMESGQVVRLIGIQAPRLANGRPGFQSWPLAYEARSFLRKLVLGGPVKLHLGPERSDRYGRMQAHLVRLEVPEGDPSWVQGEMISNGFARVHVLSDNRVCVNELYRRERAARSAARGLWSDDFYRIRRPEPSEDLIGTFQIVEGEVLVVAKHKNRYFLNFGEDWRSDFTVTIAPKHSRRFEKEIDPFGLEGKTIRVRGWVEEYNGPFIEASHPDQIEQVGDVIAAVPF